MAVADELAGAADLARTKDGNLPLVLIRGADRHVTADDGPGAGRSSGPRLRISFDSRARREAGRVATSTVLSTTATPTS